jgi:cytidylate kinase
MEQGRKIITVDGVGASGKSALARLLAERLGYAHLNSGLLYRAAAYLVDRSGASPDDSAAIQALLRQHTIRLTYDRTTGNTVVIDGVARDSELQSHEISRVASQVAKLACVREHFVPIQQHAFEPMGVVAEGRDMGTVIFPDARVKFFVNADLKVRAERRRAQLLAKGEDLDLSTIARDLARRDEEDANRALSPMKAAQGARLIDNSHGTLDEVVEGMYRAVLAS